MAEDAQEKLLGARRDEAFKALAEANAQATAAVKARNLARKSYDAALRALVSYRDELDRAASPKGSESQ